MTQNTINPPALHDPTPFGYSHTAAVSADQKLVFVSGQYGSGPDGRVVSEEFAEQVKQTLSNVESALGAHGLNLSHIVQMRTYVVGLDFEKLGAITAATQGRFGEAPPTQTMLGVAGLAMPDIFFELEVVAAAS